MATITPPDKFGLIERQVYRCGFPSPEGFGYLKRLSLRTVINLSQVHERCPTEYRPAARAPRNHRSGAA